MLLVILVKGIIEQAVPDFPDAFIAAVNVEMHAAAIYILSLEFTAVVIDGAFPYHCSDCSLHILIFFSKNDIFRS